MPDAQPGVARLPRRQRAGIIDFVVLLRPRQWMKNLLVLAAPIFAGRLFDAGTLARAVVALAAFCLVSSAAYIYNDVRDAESDRRHPSKAHRPIASGRVSPSLALWLSAGLLVAAVLAGLLSGALVAVLVVVYALLMIVYCDWGRRTPPIDVFMIAGGFLLRALAGAAGGRVPASPWFLALTLLLALMLGFGKRRAEISLLGDDAALSRSSLEVYTIALLDQLLSFLAASIVVLYAIYAVSIGHRLGTGDMILTWPLVVLGIVRYLQVSHYTLQPPDELLVSDRMILGVSIIYAVMSAAIIHFHTHLLEPVGF